MRKLMLLAAMLAVLTLSAVPTAKAESGVDFRLDVLTEHVLRSNEAYFFYLFNNSRPATEHANIVPEESFGQELLVVKFSDETIRLVSMPLGYGDDGLSFGPGEFCFRGWAAGSMPFPQDKKLYRRRGHSKFVRVAGRERWNYSYDANFIPPGSDYAYTCAIPKAGVTVEYVHRYLISPEAREVVRRWMWEKWGDTARLAQIR